MFFLDECRNLPWRERFKPYVTSRGFKVRPIYYRMVPEKDPDREGEAWFDAQRRVYPEKEIKQELEIDFSAAMGGLVYPRFDTRFNVLLRPIPLRPEWILLCSIDHGVNVTAAIFYAITPAYPDLKIPSWHLIFDEYYAGDGVDGSEAASAYDHARAIRKKAQHISDIIHGLNDDGTSRVKYNRAFRMFILDEHCWNREGAKKNLGRITDEYAEAGILAVKSAGDKRGRIEKVKRLETPIPGREHPEGLAEVNGVGYPIKFIYPCCTYYIFEKRHYRYKKDSDTKVVDRDDHLMDSEQYAVVEAIQMLSITNKPKPTKSDIELEKLMRPKHLRRNPWVNRLAR